jgi:hypothetical protein
MRTSRALLRFNGISLVWYLQLATRFYRAHMGYFDEVCDTQLLTDILAECFVGIFCG